MERYGHVFGVEADREPVGYLRLLVLFLILCGVLALRRPDALANPQFYSEDGRVFFYEEHFHHGVSLLKTHDGYSQFVPRLVAKLADIFPIVHAPLIYNLLALMVAALCSAWFSLSCFRHLIEDDRLRIAWCFLVAVLPTAFEVLLNITNIQWYLVLWAFLVCFQTV